MLPPPPNPGCCVWCSNLHLILYKIIPNCLRFVVLEDHTCFIKATAIIIFSHILSRKFSLSLCVSSQFRKMWVALFSPWHKGQVPTSNLHPQPSIIKIQFPNPHPKPSSPTPLIPITISYIFLITPSNTNFLVINQWATLNIS